MRTNETASTLTPAYDVQTLELEIENARLQRLIADLLIKNQQLRAELLAVQRTRTAVPA